MPNGPRGPFPCPVQSEVLESATSGEGFRRGNEGPTFARGLRTREREPASVAFRVQAAAGPMPSIPADNEDVVGVTSPAIAPRIGAARDAEKRMLKWSGGMEPRFISWNAAAMHTFDFIFLDAWSRKKIKAPPSRRPEVSNEVWNDVYAPADDLSRLKWSGEVKVVILEVAKECRGGTYITVDDLAPHGEESVEFLVDEELFYNAGDLTVPAQSDSGMDMRQGPSGPKPKPDANDDELMDQDEDHMEGKGEKPYEEDYGEDLGALERDLLEYQFSEGDDEEVYKRGAGQLIPSGTNKSGNGLPEEGPTKTAP